MRGRHENANPILIILYGVNDLCYYLYANDNIIECIAIRI